MRTSFRHKLTSLVAKVPADLRLELPLVCMQSVESLGPGFEGLAVGGELRHLRLTSRVS